MNKLPEPYQSLFESILWNCGAEAVPELVKKGADLNYFHPYTGATALYTATRSNNVSVIETLLRHGANPNLRLSYRSPVDGRVEAERIALHYASSEEATTALINSGSDVNAADATGTTPLMTAAFNGHVLVVRTLLAAGASPKARRKKQRQYGSYSAHELAEAKIKFFHKIICDKNRELIEKRLTQYSQICNVLLEAENLKSGP